MRIGDVSRRRRFKDPARSSYYADHRSRRWRRRFFGNPIAAAGQATSAVTPVKEETHMVNLPSSARRMESLQARVAPPPRLFAPSVAPRVDLPGSPIDAATLERLLAVLPACAQAVDTVANELGLTPEEKVAAMEGLGVEAERRAPQIIKVLLVLSLLPVIGGRAFKHFRFAKQETGHLAEELSQEMVLKVMAALTKAWPRGNVGAWLAEIRDNLYFDHHRKRRREADAMNRLETAFHALRRD